MSALKDTFLIFCPGYKYSPKIQTIFNLTFLSNSITHLSIIFCPKYSIRDAYGHHT